MKQCRRCKVDKKHMDYDLTGNGSGSRRLVCRDCLKTMRAYHREAKKIIDTEDAIFCKRHNEIIQLWRPTTQPQME